MGISEYVQKSAHEGKKKDFAKSSPMKVKFRVAPKYKGRNS